MWWKWAKCANYEESKLKEIAKYEENELKLR